jgi:hypothetical protein
MTSRFLLPMLFPAIAASLRWCRPRRPAAALYALYLLGGACAHAACLAGYGWARFEYKGLAVAWLVTAGLLVALRRLLSRARPRRALAASAVLVPLLCLPTLHAYRARVRYRAAAQSVVHHLTLKYWAPAARCVDNPGVAHTIAVTAGPVQNADNWFMYFFLGSRLQNRLCYVPVTPSGDIVDFGPDNERRQQADFDAWLARLTEQGVTHVMSFYPASIELSWMENHPDRFQPLVNEKNAWGLFRFLL